MWHLQLAIQCNLPTDNRLTSCQAGSQLKCKRHYFSAWIEVSNIGMSIWSCAVCTAYTKGVQSELTDLRFRSIHSRLMFIRRWQALSDMQRI